MLKMQKGNVMRSVDTPKRFGEHGNAFGFLRLLFASLVIVSHTPELVDGDRRRELLTRLFGTMSFGDFAVYGFFVISGFLITASFVNSPSIFSYLSKRAARIYPAFIVASLFSLLVVAPLGGAHLEQGAVRTVAAAGLRLVLLARPMVVGAFPEQHHNDWTVALNGSMWTIQYEFLCYLLVIGLVLGGVTRRPALLASLSVACLLIGRLLPGDWMLWVSRPMFLPASAACLFRLIGMFLAGASIHALQDRIRFRPWMIAAAAVGLAATLPIAPVADLGFAVFGGYLIFATAKLAGSTPLARINDRNDISYGLYLYAWPIARLLLLNLPGIDLLTLGLLTWLLAAGCGWLSWRAVEKPALSWARARLRGRSELPSFSGALARPDEGLVEVGSSPQSNHPSRSRNIHRPEMGQSRNYSGEAAGNPS